MIAHYLGGPCGSANTDEAIDRPIVFTLEQVEQIVRDATAKAVAAAEDRLLTKVEFMLDRKLAKLKPFGQTQPEYSTPSPTIPDLRTVSKIECQLFENFDQPKESKRPKVQLKLYVWTCGRSQIAKHRRGNCGEIYVPLHRPDNKHGRQRLKSILPLIEKIDPEHQYVKYAGRVAGKNDRQVALISHDGVLGMMVDGETLKFGMPKPAADDALDNAAKLRWYWPDCFGNSFKDSER